MNNIKRILCSALSAAAICTCVAFPSTVKLPIANISIVNSIEANAVTVEEYTFYVATANVNERTGPGTNYKKVGLVKKGERVTVFESRNGWGRITPASAKNQVWVCLSYFKKTTCPARVSTPSGVNVRSTPSINGKKVGALSNGTKVTIYKVHIDAAGRFWGAINSKCDRWVCCVDKDGSEYVPCTG